MGAKTRYRPQPDSGYDVRVTDLSATPFNATGASSGPQAVQPGDTVIGTDAAGNPIIKRGGQWVNKNVANTTPFLLTAGISVRVLPANPKRTGILLCNKDAANVLNYSWGNDAGLLGHALGPGATLLLDFTTPSSELYVISGTANMQISVGEMVRSG